MQEHIPEYKEPWKAVGETDNKQKEGAKYLLGVDGGNTKTDYLIFTTDGTFVSL